MTYPARSGKATAFQLAVMVPHIVGSLRVRFKGVGGAAALAILFWVCIFGKSTAEVIL
jgi:hypothetical protein